jgi:hypothetical protein
MLTLLSMTENVSGTSPMLPIEPDSQSMTPMTTDFTDNTEESGNSSTKAVLPSQFFAFSDIYINFCNFLRVGNTGFLG